MRLKKCLSVIALLGLGLTTLVACDGGGQNGSGDSTDKVPVDASKIYISCAAEDAAFNKEKAEEYIRENKLPYTIVTLDIGDDKVDSTIPDWSSGTAPDIYSFASDKNTPLLSANALDSVPDDYATAMRESLDASAIKNVEVGGKLTSYPYTSSNGYFCYYNDNCVQQAIKKGVLNGKTDPNEFTMNDWIAVAKATNTTIEYPLVTPFYGAAALTSTGARWTVKFDRQNRVESVTSNFAEKALGLAKEIREWETSGVLTDIDGTQDAPTNNAKICMTVNGPWAMNNAANGDKSAYNTSYIKYCMLPKLESGKRINSFAGTKNFGVNPMKSQGTENSQRLSDIHAIANYLASSKVQEERYNHNHSFIPSDKALKDSDTVKNEPFVQTFNNQMKEASIEQANLPANIWTAPGTFITGLKDGTYNDEATILEGLKTLDDSLSKVN